MKFSFKFKIFSQNLLIFFIGACLLVGFYYSGVAAQDLNDKAAVSALGVATPQTPVAAENNGVLAICQNISQAENPLEQVAKTLVSIKQVEIFSGKAENPPKVVKKINVIATAYSSTPWQTDDTPFITANGATVRDGIIANNMLAFGTQVRIPQLYGNKVFTVEDRMHWRKSNYQIDIWFPSLDQAVNFGVKTAYIEVLN
jgi:3D (Asp-Asp-Asp) domain-containing protein